MKVFPVIHYFDWATTIANGDLAVQSGADGVFVISMDGNDRAALAAAMVLKDRHPAFPVGCNALTIGPLASVKRNLAVGLDMTWSDTPGITSAGITTEADLVAEEVRAHGGSHVFFASVAFKYQAHEADPGRAAMLAASMGFLPTTSGAATGQPADRNKLGAMRAALGSGPLGIASGVTPENVAAHRGLVTHILVSTGISNSFYTFDEESLRSLIEKAHA